MVVNYLAQLVNNLMYSRFSTSPFVYVIRICRNSTAVLLFLSSFDQLLCNFPSFGMVFYAIQCLLNIICSCSKTANATKYSTSNSSNCCNCYCRYILLQLRHLCQVMQLYKV